MGRYIPETQSEQESMLKDIGLSSIDDLYSMVPKEVLLKDLRLPAGKSEMEVLEEISGIAGKDLVYDQYGRRLLGLKFTASIALTDPLNLPAPGRRQLLYIVLRLSRNLCFW